MEELTPVACLSIHDLGYEFLLVNIDPEDSNIAYALADFDTRVENQYINIALLKKMANDNGTQLVSKKDFEATHTLKEFRNVAKYFGTVISDDKDEYFSRFLKACSV